MITTRSTTSIPRWLTGGHAHHAASFGRFSYGSSSVRLVGWPVESFSTNAVSNFWRNSGDDKKLYGVVGCVLDYQSSSIDGSHICKNVTMRWKTTCMLYFSKDNATIYNWAILHYILEKCYSWEKPASVNMPEVSCYICATNPNLRIQYYTTEDYSISKHNTTIFWGLPNTNNKQLLPLELHRRDR